MSASQTAEIKFETYNPFNEFETVERIWLSLLEKQPHSFFLSWGWMSTWINSLPRDLDLRLAAGWQGEKPVIAFFIGESKKRRHGFMHSNCLSLNATANRFFDELTIEYNAILGEAPLALYRAGLYQYLRSLQWDEFILPGISQAFVSELHLLEEDNLPFPRIIDRVSNSHFVELEKIRAAGMDYLKLLSANRRSQIRRSVKEYETGGRIRVRQAADTEEALVMLEALASLHQQTWQKRGRAGSFSNPYFRQFHNDLVRRRFGSGEIQLLQIRNDKMTIGFLYNFVHQGEVLFYQSGFNYSNGNVHRPGLVSHYFAILHNAEQNLKTYDFLAGDAEYKSSMATASRPMYWLRWFKNPRRFNFEKNLLKTKETVKGWLRALKIYDSPSSLP